MSGTKKPLPAQRGEVGRRPGEGQASRKPLPAQRGEVGRRPGEGRRRRRLVAVVTGASRGIGAAVAHALALHGCDVVVTSTRQHGTRDVAADLARIPGARIVEVRYEASSRASADALVRRTLNTLGTPDVLVNNAGLVVRRALDEMSDDDFDRVLAANLSGPFYLCRRFLPLMQRAGGGTIVNISSISATLGNPTAVGYCASKAGLDAVTRSLAADFPRTGVRVASVRPGSVATDMLEGSGFPPDMSAEDVAKVVRFLALEAPDAVNGTHVELFQ